MLTFKSFRCNTSLPPHMCCRQRTCAILKSFRCNTYKKIGGVGLPAVFSCQSVHVPHRRGISRDDWDYSRHVSNAIENQDRLSPQAFLLVSASVCFSQFCRMPRTPARQGGTAAAKRR